jgi:hypothetical protein
MEYRWYLKCLEPRSLEFNIYKTEDHRFNHKNVMKGKNGIRGIRLGFSYHKFVPNPSYTDLEHNVNDH